MIRTATPDPFTIAEVASAIRNDLALNPNDVATPLRRAAELSSAVERLSADDLERVLAAPAPSTGDRRWDAFVAALAEWLAVCNGALAPAWVFEPQRRLNQGWWVTPMQSMYSWEYAGSPASFQHRGVYIHRDSLTNI